MEKEKPDFRNVSLKTDLVNAVEAYIHRTKRYRSIADFVSEAVRLRLEALETLENTVEA